MKKIERIPEDEQVEMDLGDGEEEPGEDDDGWESRIVEKEPDNWWESGSIAGQSSEYMDEDHPSNSQEAIKKPSTKSGSVRKVMQKLPLASRDFCLPYQLSSFVARILIEVTMRIRLLTSVRERTDGARGLDNGMYFILSIAQTFSNLVQMQ